MKKWRCTALATVMVAALALAGAVWQAARSREPVYQGKPLSVLLEQFNWRISGGALIPSQSHLRDETATAMRQIGTNAIPFLLRMAAVEDSPVKKWILKHYPVSNRMAARLLSQPVCFRWAAKSTQNPEYAFVGFKLLGRDAKAHLRQA